MKETILELQKSTKIINNILDESSGVNYSLTSVSGTFQTVFSPPGGSGRKLTRKDKKYFIDYLEREFNVIVEWDDVILLNDSFEVIFRLENRNGYDIKNILKAIPKINIRI
jgi:hypothetical protein